ncbi:MAG: peptide-methionine (S)-S-oxide reductase, partial [Thermoprotei archaeon]
FYHDENQKEAALKKIARLESEHVFDAPIVTQVEPFKAFYRAEEYHQHYFRKNPDKPYCRLVVSPKVAKLRHTFASRLKTAPPSVS